MIDSMRILKAVLLSFAVVILCSTAVVESAYSADLTKVSTAHPRLHINSANQSALRAKVLGPLSSEYNSMKSAMNGVPGKNGWSYAGANADIQTVLATACALIYQMEGDVTWTTAPIAAATTPHGFSFGNDDGGHYLEMYAVVYDWLYGVLSASEKQTIRNNIASIADAFLAQYTTEIKLDDYHNYMTQWVNGIMAAGLAIYHDDPVRGKNYIDFATQVLYEGHTFQNAHNEQTVWNFKESLNYSGGYSDFEGLDYFKNGMPEIARAIEAWDTATLGIFDMWNTHFQKMVNAGYFVMYGHTATGYRVKFEDSNPVSYSISSKYMGILSLLEGNFSDGHLKSFIDDKYPGVTDWQYGNSFKVFYLLYYDPSVASIDYKTLSPDRAADNYYFMKSGWNASDTYVAFKAGTHYGYHTHSDHNGFFIWSNGNLLSAPGGMYESGCITFDHPQLNQTAWNRQTVSGNAITVVDPTDVYSWKPTVPWAATLPNAGGQRMPYLRHNPPHSFHESYSNMPWSGYMLANDPVTSEIFKFADVTAWESQDPYFSYVRSDATKAYSNNYSGLGTNENDKVNLIEREFVYLKPNYIVTYDRVNAKSASHTKSYILHSIGAPTVFDGSWKNPAAGVTDYASANRAKMDSGAGRLFIKTFQPSSNFKYHVIGGAGYENYIESTNTNYGPSCTIKDYNMRWRIEVQPTDSQKDHVFLNLLEIADTSQTDIVGSDLIVSSSGNMKGVLIKDGAENKVVMFSSDPAGAAIGGDVAYSANSTATSRHILLDMPPSTLYYIHIDGTLAATQTSSANGTLMFTDPISGNHSYVISLNDLSGSITLPVAGTGSGGGGCFIATASFGTPLAPQVRLLSEFRDEYLLTNGPGRWFVRMYYTYSPPLADYIRDRETLKAVIRAGLLPLIAFGDFMVNTTPAQKRLTVGAILALLTVAGSLLLHRRRHASALYPLRTER